MKPGTSEYRRVKTAEWRKKNPEKYLIQSRMNRALRRARIKGARIEKHIRVTWLHNWSSRICGICNIYIEGDYQLDHIIPLSRGGEHSVANLQLAHPYCNKSKFNRLQDEFIMVI